MRKSLVLCLATVGVLALTFGTSCQEKAAPVVEPVPEPIVPALPASLSEATIAESVDNYNRPVVKRDSFYDDITTIYCSVKLYNAPDNTEIKAEWVYLGEGEKLTISEESLIRSGTGYVSFEKGQPFGGWLLGDYEVKLYLNGNEEVVLPFRIVATPPPPEVKMLLISASGYVSGSQYEINGTVLNKGNVTLHDILVEVLSYDKNGNLVRTDTTPLEPSTLPPDEKAHFWFRILDSRHQIKNYSLRFVLPSGEEIRYDWQ